METTTITIKKTLLSDKEYLHEIASIHNKPVADALSIVVEDSKQFVSANQLFKETRLENEKLKAEILQITEQENTIIAQLQTVSEGNKKMFSDYETILEEKRKLLEENEKLKSEIETVNLSGTQFICELEEQTAINAMKVKGAAIKEGYVIGNDYPNELVNAATKYFLSKKFAELID